jgi:hypothetical protein
MIIKRREDQPPTTLIQIGSTRWSFSALHRFFAIPDEDTFRVLTRGEFELIRRAELDKLRSEDVFVVYRLGPAITDN